MDHRGFAGFQNLVPIQLSPSWPGRFKLIAIRSPRTPLERFILE